MKIITLKKKKIFRLFSIISFLIIISKISTSFAMQHYYEVDFSTGIVTATTLNVRSGPGTNYKIVTTVNKNEYIRVFAGVGDWYIVQVEGDYIGAVSKKYIKAIYANTSGNSQGSTSNSTGSSSMNSDEKEVFDLINNQRTKNGLSSLKVDEEVQRVARIKAEDMVSNNYF